MRLQDRTADTLKSDKVKKVYNNVASPNNKVVHRGLEMRHAMLCSMFPYWTPRAERIVDYLMSVTEDEFMVLCHHEGTTVVLSHEKLDLIGQAIEEKHGPVTLFKQPEDETVITEDELEDESLVAALLAS